MTTTAARLTTAYAAAYAAYADVDDAIIASVSYQTNRVIKAIVEVARLTIESTPIVGDGANVYGYSDVYAHTVVKVSKSGDVAWIQRDKATLLNGANSGEPDALHFSPGGFCGHTSGTQRYSYERDPNGEILRISRRKDGTWRTKGAGTGASRVRFGERRERYDFNF